MVSVEWEVMSEQRANKARPTLIVNAGYTRLAKSRGPIVPWDACSSSPPTPLYNSSETMPEKVVETPYSLIDSDPHFSRVMRYMRPSDYVWWGALTAAFPGLLVGWRASIYFLISLWSIVNCLDTD